MLFAPLLTLVDLACVSANPNRDYLRFFLFWSIRPLVAEDACRLAKTHLTVDLPKSLVVFPVPSPAQKLGSSPFAKTC
jgi:hypothetical protein